MITINFTSKMSHQANVGDLKYGTWLRGVEGHRDSLYIKVHKHCLGQGLDLEWPHNCSVLLNVRTGSLRAVTGSSVVDVLDCEIDLWNTKDIDENMK